MRVTRAKQYRKHLRFFRIVYGISAPYKVILDGNFIHGCISSKVDIEKRLTSVLQGAKMHLFVPRSAREELKALGPEFQKAYNFAIGHCRGLPPPRNENQAGVGVGIGRGGGGRGGGEKGPDPAKEIIAAIGADNEGKYLVASQDEKLRVRLRRVPGCPLVFVSRTVLVMEQPSGKSKAEFEKAERKKAVGTTEEEDRVLAVLKKREREERERERALQPRKRLKRGPPPRIRSPPRRAAKAQATAVAAAAAAEVAVVPALRVAGLKAAPGRARRAARPRREARKSRSQEAKKPSASSAASGSGGA